MSEREIGDIGGEANPQSAPRVDSRAGKSRIGWGQLEPLISRKDLSQRWLQLIASQIRGVTQGLVLLREEEGEGFYPSGVWPEGGGRLDVLGRAAQKCLQTGQPVFLPGGVTPGEGRPRVACPLMTEGKAWGVVALEIEPRSEERMKRLVLDVQACSGWLRKLDPYQSSALVDEGANGARFVLACIAVLAEKDKFKAKALAMAVRLERELHCERVSIGTMKRRRVTVVAVSTSPQFAQKTNLVRSIENAMEEACDQEATVQHPSPEGSPFVASMAHRSHARAYGHRSILSIPFDRSGEIVGAITLERPEGHPFTEDEVLAIEAVSALAGPQLDLSMREDRWIGAKLRESASRGIANLFGGNGGVYGVVSGIVIGLIVFASLWKTDYRVASDVFLEAQKQLLIATPVQGFVLTAPARAGDIVKKGDLLYQLDDAELRLERERLSGEKSKASKRHLQALASGSPSEVRILAAQIEQLRAEIKLSDLQLARMQVISPIDGVVVSGDLSQSLGAPLERGEVAYSVAPLDGYRVVLKVKDADIDECRVGQEAAVVMTALPNSELPANVDKITPVSISEEGITYFRVEASLRASDISALRPGMEGVGKIKVGERSLLWVWTHRAMDWLRLLLWEWTP